MELGRVGVVLPGGGCKCAFQAGALRFLVENKIAPEKVQGVSGGALNAAKFVENGVDSLEQVWRDVERIGPKAVFTGNMTWNIVNFKPALYTDDGLLRLVNQLDMRKIVSSPIKFEVVVWNELTELQEVFYNGDFNQDIFSQERFRRIIKASSSMPGFFNPEKLDEDHIYSDGCVFSLKTFADLDSIFVIDTSQQHLPSDYSKSASFKRMMKRFSTMIDHSGFEAIETFVRTHKYRVMPEDESKPPLLLRGYKEAFNDFQGGFGEFLKGLIGLPVRRLVVISPEINIETLMLDSFKPGDISHSIEHGYQCAAEVFKLLE